MSFISNRFVVLVSAWLLAVPGLASLQAGSSSADYSILNNAFLSGGGESSSAAYSVDYCVGDFGGPNPTNNDVSILTGNSGQLNQPPVIYGLTDTTADGVPSTLQNFTVSDLDSVPSAIRVTASSSDAVLIPPTGIILGGTGAARTIQLFPARGLSGITVVTVEATDDEGLKTAASFTLSVVAIKKKTPVLIWAPPASITYGTALGALQLNATADVSGVFTYNPPAGTILPAGQVRTLSVVFTPTDQDAYEDASASTPITVKQVVLTITANNQAKVYGDAVPLLSANYRGFVNGDNASVLDTPVSLTTTATPASKVGSYVIIPGGASAANYTINFVNGTLAIQPAPLVIRVNDLSKHLTAALPTLTASYSGLVNGDTPASLNVPPSLTTAATSSSPPGSYPIYVNGAASANYAITFVNGTLTVVYINDPPSISEIGDQVIDEDTVSSEIPFIVGDFENAPGQLSVSIQSSNPTLIASGGMVLGGSGASRTMVLTPSPNAFGSADLTLSVRDTGGAETVRKFTLTVNPVNDPPVADAQTVVTVQNVAKRLKLTGSDQENDPLTYKIVTLPAKGILSGTAPNLTFTPILNVNGSDSFTFVVNDGLADSLPATVMLNISPVNSSPTISSLVDQTIDEDAITGAIAFTVSDVETEATLLSVTGQSSNPSLIDSAHIAFEGSGSNRTVTLTPLPNQSGTSTITLTVRDGDGGQASWSFRLIVRPVNDAPVLSAISNQVVDEGTTLIVNAAASNIESATETLTFCFVSSPPGASIDPVTGVVTWTPAESQGPDTYPITIRVTDNGTPPLSATTTFFVQVNEVNTKPRLAEVGNQVVTEGGTLRFNLSATDDDRPANALIYTLASGAATGATVSSAGLFSWVPSELQGPGVYTFTVSVSDNGSPSLSDQTSFTVTVLDANTAPILAPIPDQTIAEGGLLTLTAIANDSDLPRQDLTFSLGAGAPEGMSIDSRSGLITWMPTEVQGPSTNLVTVVVRDNGSGPLSSSQIFRVVVTEVNLPPTISSIPNQTILKNSSTALIHFLVDDPDMPLQSLVVSGFSADPILVPIGGLLFGGVGTNRTLQITPGTNQLGTTTITMEVEDGAGGHASFTFQLAVIAQPDVISQMRWMEDGFHFKLSVPTGLQARIEASTDLINWIDITRNPLVGMVDFLDQDSLVTSARFYRVLLE